MGFCPKCGAAVPSDASFCPRCGTAVAAATPPAASADPAPPERGGAATGATHTPPAGSGQIPPPAPAHAAPARQPRRTGWWIVPLVIVGLIVLAWLILAGLPFGGGDEKPEAPLTETIAEGAPQGETATLVEVPPTGTAIGGNPQIIEGTPAAVAGQQVPPPATAEEGDTAAPAGEIGESEGLGVLRSYVTSRDFYGVRDDCISLQSQGYKNRGYTIEVHDSCGSRMLGRWRVDALTRAVYRQREDGRYLSP